jgi:hypothetical protein
MTVEEANYLGPGDALRVNAEGLHRHGLEGRSAQGSYVSQFESPKNGRLIVVRLPDTRAFGFRLDELEIVRLLRRKGPRGAE